MITDLFDSERFGIWTDEEGWITLHDAGRGLSLSFTDPEDFQELVDAVMEAQKSLALLAAKTNEIPN